MARLGAEQELEYILFSSPPVDLAKALEDDCNGVFFNRLCTDLDVMFWFKWNRHFTKKKITNINNIINMLFFCVGNLINLFF